MSLMLLRYRPRGKRCPAQTYSWQECCWVDIAIRIAEDGSDRDTLKREVKRKWMPGGQLPGCCAAMRPSIVNCVRAWRACLTPVPQRWISAKLQSYGGAEADTLTTYPTPRSLSTSGLKGLLVRPSTTLLRAPSGNSGCRKNGPNRFGASTAHFSRRYTARCPADPGDRLVGCNQIGFWLY